MDIVEKDFSESLNKELSSINILQYHEKFKAKWDEFVTNSKNGTFLLYRDYMEYHCDRFLDNSVMFFDEKDNLIAIMPANIKENVMLSHGGLTYGGIISGNKMSTALMLELFNVLKKYLVSKGINELKYKTIPHIYHSIPAEEDLYALFINNASLVKRDVSTTIYLKEKLNLSKGRKYNIKKAIKAGLQIKQNQNFQGFMEIEKKILEEKYGTKPVHTSEEIALLAKRFPDNIKLFSAYLEEEMLSGVIVYETKNTVHTQYMANSEKGRDYNGLDLIINYLTDEYYIDKQYFDFGISTEDEGRYLNTGLINQKETFGGRATVYDTYKLLLQPNTFS